ncbi:MAG: heme biosynthesis protein HemY [Betaproteobacteria bacterium]|nr:heme biosynthesis protein HemY [Betaproteobacteria bacterium]
MRVLIWIIIIFALAVGLSMLASQNWGYVQFVVPKSWLVQMPAKLFVVALLAAFIAVYLLIRLMRNALSLPEAVGQWRERRRRLQADRSLREAVVTLHEGRYAKALKFAEKAYETSDSPEAAILLAARAAHALCDEDRYREWIGRLGGEEEKVQAARLMTEAELAVISRDYEEAAKKLDILQPDGRRNIAAMRLLLRVSMALWRWDESLRLIRLLRKHKALTEEQARPLLCRVHIERLRACADGDGDDNSKNDVLSEMWKAIPAEEREDRRLMLEAVPLFARMGKGYVVRRTVERLLDAEWDTALARLYGLCGDIGACLSKGENWLPDHREDPGLLFSLGRLCAELQLWGKAVEYFELSLRWQPEVETHLALANLFKRLERDEDEQKHYRAAAEMVAAW